EISILTLKLFIVLLHGLIASVIFEKLTIHHKWTPFKFVYNSIIFGVLSYLSAHLFLGIFNFLTCSKILLFQDSEDNFSAFWNNISTKEIDFSIVVWATIFSMIVSIAAVYLDFNKFFNKIGKFLRVTNKYGDESLFYKFLNSEDVFEVYIRDEQNGITYHGLIDSYSESEGCSEKIGR